MKSAVVRERILELFDKSPLSDKAIEKELGLPAAVISKWRNQGLQSYSKYINQIAAFFCVSPDFLTGATDNPDPLPKGAMPAHFENVSLFPMIGEVKAGYNGAAPTYSGELVPFSTAGLHDDPMNYFAFRVKGDSMYPRMLDGDIVLCHRTSSVDSGKTAVLIYNGDEITVKKVRYVSGGDWLELVPTNPEYQTRRIEKADLEKCKVLGEVVALTRNEI